MTWTNPTTPLIKKRWLPIYPFKGINRRYIGKINIIKHLAEKYILALYGSWGRIRVRKRLAQGVRRVCPPGKPILRKSIPTGKTQVIRHITIFVSFPGLLTIPTRRGMQFEAGSTDREPEISVLDTFRDGFRFVPYVLTWLCIWMHNSTITTF